MFIRKIDGTVYFNIGAVILSLQEENSTFLI